jgi:thiamine biosynthesis lipoprotein
MSTRVLPPARRLRVAPLLLFAIVAAAVAWVALRPTAPSDEQITIGGNTMGGTWSVKLRRLPPDMASAELQSRLQVRLISLEGAMTTYTHASPVTRFNECRGTDWFDVPRELADVVAAAQEVSQQTGGVFDVTVSPLVNLWGFGPESRGVRKGEIPSDTAIAAARTHVGYAKLHVRANPPALRKDDPDLAIDLSAIGKGYAAGKLAADLDALNVSDYLIAVGGELRAKGSSAPQHGGWPVGIEVPTPDTRRILQSIDLRDAGLSTSGDYRNFVDLAGRRYSHEIDPRTGRPVTGDLASVSVVHPDSACADAMATALFVLGPDEGYALATRLDVAALFVTRGHDAFATRATPAYRRLTPTRSFE